MSNATLKPIVIHGNGGPNPTKVIVLLEVLGLPYTALNVAFSDVKGPSYTALNPNGRLPTIEDPNTGIKVWESGAIVTYLINTYDRDHKFSFEANTPDAWHAQQWLHLQATGQGPYYGQAVWFKKFNPEPNPSAVKRYVGEINRITSVLDGWLAKRSEGAEGGKWLVGGKLSYADLAFVSYQITANTWFAKDEFDPKQYPEVKKWLERMMKTEAVTAALSKCVPYNEYVN